MRPIGPDSALSSSVDFVNRPLERSERTTKLPVMSCHSGPKVSGVAPVLEKLSGTVCQDAKKKMADING